MFSGMKGGLPPNHCQNGRKPGDGFVIPAWCTHHHHNSSQENAYLFTTSDRPIVETLGLYREEAI